jgi:hypothetical protein
VLYGVVRAHLTEPLATVDAQYSTGAQHGFVVFDRVETDDEEEAFDSREAGSRRPTLVVTFGLQEPRRVTRSASPLPPSARPSTPSARP